MFTGNESHEISFENASLLTKEWRTKHPDSIKGGYFSKSSLSTLLNQSECVGIRIYLGEENGSIKFVLVGVNGDEDDLIGEGYQCMEYSIPCPTRCGTANILNS